MVVFKVSCVLQITLKESSKASVEVFWFEILNTYIECLAALPVMYVSRLLSVAHLKSVGFWYDQHSALLV